MVKAIDHLRYLLFVLVVLEALIYVLCVMANRIYSEKDYAPFVFDSYTVVVVQHTDVSSLK